jgi:iron complex outermembrane receptor protein
MIRRYILLVLTAATASAALSAQTLDSTTSKTRISLSKTPEVTITAMRQSERVLEVPLAVTVVPKEFFQSSRGFGLDEALSLVPGALVQSRTGNQDVRVLIRGFGARGAGERSNAGTSRGVRFYIDGIPETEPDGRTAFDLIDLSGASSIEVLRSNASALWGNAAGGVVSVSTVPTADRAFIAGQFQTGSFGFQKHSLRAMTFTGTKPEDGKLFISLNNTMFDGWRAQSRSLLSQFNAGWTANVSDKTKLGVFLAGASNNFQIPGPLTQSQFDDNPQQAQGDARIYSPSYVERNERRHNRLGRIGTTMEHSIDLNNSLSAMAFTGNKYLQRSERNTFRDFTRYHMGGNLIYRNSIQLGDGVRSQFLVGTDMQYQDGAILFYNLVNGQRGTTVRDNRREGAWNFGAFAQEELTFDRLSVVGGLRYDNITYFYDNFINPKLNEHRTFERLTPKCGLTYHLLPTMTVYANLGGGVEVPAGNETDPPSVFGEDTLRSVNSLLKPIQSTTFEAGLKQVVLFDGESILQSLSYDVAAFLINVTDDLIPYRGGRFYLNAGRTQRIGAELGGQASFAGGFILYGMLTLMQSRFVDYKVDSGFVNPSLDGRIADLSGNKQPGIPDVFATFRIRYAPAFLSGLFAEVEARLVGSYFADDMNTLVAPAVTVLDGVVGYQGDITHNLRVNALLRVNNLAGSKYVASIWMNPDRPANAQPAFIEPGLPRAFVGSLGLEWRF